MQKQKNTPAYGVHTEHLPKLNVSHLYHSAKSIQWSTQYTPRCGPRGTTCLLITCFLFSPIGRNKCNHRVSSLLRKIHSLEQNYRSVYPSYSCGSLVWLANKTKLIALFYSKAFCSSLNH